jgi:hypothetical protein
MSGVNSSCARRGRAREPFAPAALIALAVIASCKPRPESVLESLRTTFPGHGIALSTMTETRKVDAVLWSEDLRAVEATLHWEPGPEGAAGGRWRVRNATGTEIASGANDALRLGLANVSVYAAYRLSREPARATAGFVHPGCDFIGTSDGGKIDDRCGTMAAGCCNAHDDCYRDNLCTVRSWTGGESAACARCNEAVKACFSTGTGGRACSASTGYCCGTGEAPPSRAASVSPEAGAPARFRCENTAWLGGADPAASNNQCPTFFYSAGTMASVF